MENVNSVLPGWETVRFIGAGSSGKVFELKKKDEYGSDFHSALKVVTIPSTQEECEKFQSTMSEFAMRAHLREQVEHISSEYRLMSVLKGHPNIVSCEDTMIVPHSDDLGWDIYIRMELLSSLPDFVQANGITGADVIKLGSDICSALETCRVNGIIHRDIKPQNIFVSKYGDYKLGDFGVALMQKNTVTDKVGTFSYMAPEVYKCRDYTDSVDIYSLGMVLYWLLNERRGPFLPLPPMTPSSEQIADAQLRRYRGEKLPPPKNGSAALKAVVLKACAFNKEERFQSPAEMRQALADAAVKRTPSPAVSDDEVTVREDAPVYPEKQTPVFTPPKKPAPTPEDEGDGSSGTALTVVLILLIAAIIIGTAFFLINKLDLFGGDEPAETAPPVQSQELIETPPPYSVSSVVMSSPSISLIEGAAKELHASCMPEPSESDTPPSLIWRSSDSSVATVDNTGLVTAVSEGVVTVRVYVEDDMDIYDECTVTVEAAVVTELIVEQLPDKTEYHMGEELVPDGLVLRASYNNDSIERITDLSVCSFDYDLSGIGSKTVSVSYKGATAEFTVRVFIF